AREFSIRLRASVSSTRRGRSHPETEVTFAAFFINTDSQAAIQPISISAHGESLIARLDNERLAISFQSRTGDVFPLTEPDQYPRVLRTEFGRYWPFLLRELRYRIQRSVASAQQS